jgi:hypothetical protein
LCEPEVTQGIYKFFLDVERVLFNYNGPHWLFHKDTGAPFVHEQKESLPAFQEKIEDYNEHKRWLIFQGDPIVYEDIWFVFICGPMLMIWLYLGHIHWAGVLEEISNTHQDELPYFLTFVINNFESLHNFLHYYGFSYSFSKRDTSSVGSLNYGLVPFVSRLDVVIDKDSLAEYNNVFRLYHKDYMYQMSMPLQMLSRLQAFIMHVIYWSGSFVLEDAYSHFWYISMLKALLILILSSCLTFDKRLNAIAIATVKSNSISLKTLKKTLENMFVSFSPFNEKVKAFFKRNDSNS